MQGIVDLHTHSCFSDGTMAPEEILKRAEQNGVGMLAITDHNVLEGARTLQQLAKDTSVHCISGVEVDAIELGINFHILGYGIRLDDPSFIAFCKANRMRLEEVNRKLILKMEQANEPVSVSEYDNFTYDCRKGGWSALHYFLAKGLADSLEQGMQIYGKYKHSYTCVDFPSITEVVSQIHLAGGYAILAHPGETLKHETKQSMQSIIEEVMNYGLDGIECFYPCHSKELTSFCFALCQKKQRITTCGSDCHGAFGMSDVGQLPVRIEELLGLEQFLAISHDR